MSPRRTVGAIALPSLFLIACGGEPAGPGGGEPGPDAGPPATIELDLFGPVGHRFRFLISPEQATQMESSGFDPGEEDQYEIGGGTYADDVIVTDAADGEVGALGKIEVKLIGQSSSRPWNRIPNLRLDLDEFQPGRRIDGVEHLRFNNGQVGGIFREAIALRLWGALGYPVPRASFGWVEAPNQWGEGVAVPYTMVEVYKPGWCEHAMGGCANLWEAAGEIDALRGQCQFDACEDARLDELTDLMAQNQPGPGYAAALASHIDWEAFHTFSCLSWISATGDDYVHNTNNVVMVERTDGRFQLLPYSVDISAGQSWYPVVGLLGRSQLSVGCQNDPACWQDLLARCDGLLDQIEAMDLVGTLVEPTIAGLTAAGMERDGDPARADELRGWYAGRAAELRADPVWTAQPCLSDEACAGREDGKTYCYEVCMEPPPSCIEEPCPDGFWCDELGNCNPG